MQVLRDPFWYTNRSAEIAFNKTLIFNCAITTALRLLPATTTVHCDVMFLFFSYSSEYKLF